MHEVGFILLDRDAKLGSHGPKIHLVEHFYVMKSETPQDKRLVGFGYYYRRTRCDLDCFKFRGIVHPR